VALMEDIRRVSIIVPHYNDLAALDRCLDDLSRQTYPVHEIIVADNKSPVGPDAVASVVGDRAKLVVVVDKGAGPARNGGVQAATGEVLAFIDSDCRPEPEWVGNGVKALDHWDFVGGQVKVLVDDPAAMTPTEAFEMVFAFNNAWYVAKLGFTVSANLFCSRKLFDDVGGFGVGVSEDVEWCRRATAKGHRLGYAASAVVGHPARRTWPELIRKWTRTNQEGFVLQSKMKHGRMRFLMRSLLLPLSILAHAPRIFLSRKLSSMRDRFSALGVLVRLRLWRLGHSIGLLVEHARERA
jgi:glycosyltransferase involved in cell wall biosynthesis